MLRLRVTGRPIAARSHSGGSSSSSRRRAARGDATGRSCMVRCSASSLTRKRHGGQQVVHARAADAEDVGDVLLLVDLRPHQHHPLHALGELAQLVHRRQELEPLVQPVARIRRLALESATLLVPRRLDRRTCRARGRASTPHAARSGTASPASSAVARRLVAEELDPRERARVLDVLLAEPADELRDRRLQLRVEREEELGLVPAEPYRGLIAARFRRGPGGSCAGKCPRSVPVAGDRPVRF